MKMKSSMRHIEGNGLKMIIFHEKYFCLRIKNYKHNLLQKKKLSDGGMKTFPSHHAMTRVKIN